MRWIIRRVLIALATIFTAVTLMFFLIRLMPGNPVDAFIANMIAKYGGSMSYDEILAQARAIFSIMPTDPIHVQYINFIKNVFLVFIGKGDLGRSISTAPMTPVIELIAKRIVWTVFVLSISLVIAFTTGIFLGMFLAYRRGKVYESGATLFLTMLKSIPDYIIATLLLLAFAVYNEIFPYGGNYSMEAAMALEKGNYFVFIADVFWHAALPIISYVIVNLPFWSLTMRASTITVLGEDYVTVAEARGLSSKRIAFIYVGKNAILPLFTQFMLALGGIFGGAVFIEYVFKYPGMGLLLVEAIQNRDYTLIQGIFLITVSAIVIGILLADLLYAKLDPRIRRE